MLPAAPQLGLRVPADLVQPSGDGQRDGFHGLHHAMAVDFPTQLVTPQPSRINRDVQYGLLQPNPADQDGEDADAGDGRQKPGYRQVFFAPRATLNNVAHEFYIARHNRRARDTVDCDGCDSDSDDDARNGKAGGGLGSQDSFDRLDSRGKQMRVRRARLQHEIRYTDSQTQATAYSFATVNLDPSTYLTQQELKQRAKSLAHSQYKSEKREYARHVAKKKLLWIMAVVKCKVFVSKLKKRAQETRERKQQEERE